MDRDDRAVRILADHDMICRYKRCSQNIRLTIAEFHQEFERLDHRPDRMDPKIVAIRDAIYNIIRTHLSGKGEAAMVAIMKPLHEEYSKAKTAAGVA